MSVTHRPDDLCMLNMGIDLLRSELDCKSELTELDHIYFSYLLTEIVRDINRYYGRESLI